MKFGRSDFLLLNEDLVKDVENLPPSVGSIGALRLYTRFKHNFAESDKGACLLIGTLFSSEKPEASQQELVEYVNESENFEIALERLSYCAGRFVFVFHREVTKVLHDALGQFEVYYDAGTNCIASSLHLIASVVSVHTWEDEVGRLYEKISKTSRIQIGTTTKYENVKHLMPNHFVEIGDPEQVRYFPNKGAFSKALSLEDGAAKLGEILKSTCKSLAKDYKLALPVTGGNDSRILLGALRDQELHTFIFRHPWVQGKVLDIEIGKELLNAVGRSYDVIVYDEEIRDENLEFLSSLPVPPRKESVKFIINGYKEHLVPEMVLFGHGGEVGRSFFKDLRPISKEKCAVLMEHGTSDFVKSKMQDWIDGLDPDLIDHENIFDLFYWEQRMGNWGARIITESSEVIDVVSPMNSHVFLLTMLQIPKKHRQYYGNDVVKALVNYLDSRLSGFPINPKFKNRVINALIRLGVYDLYQNIRMFFLIRLSKKS